MIDPKFYSMNNRDHFRYFSPVVNFICFIKCHINKHIGIEISFDVVCFLTIVVRDLATYSFTTRVPVPRYPRIIIYPFSN